MKVPFIDIHTHHPANSEEIISILSLLLQDIDFDVTLKTPFSAAIHPWHATRFENYQVKLLLENLSRQPNLLAIGETGLDKVCSADYRRQREIFELHLGFAEMLNKPLIIHTVKSWNELIVYLKKTNAICILHGYAEGITLTRQLINLGCYFSIGKSAGNIAPRLREGIQTIPVTSLLLETDDSKESIIDIYRKVSEIVDLSLDELKIQIYKNFISIFHLKT